MDTFKKLCFAFLLAGAVLVPFRTFAQTVPSRLAIPSIRLAALIEPVGTDADGSMSVPIAPNAVGWYASGTVPGEWGTAVLDAHVYLAFRNLKNVKKGSNIYVTKS